MSLIIFFIESKFNRRDYHRYGFDILISNGFDVWVWDFSPWLRPEYHNTYEPPDEINYANIIYLRSSEDFREKANQISPNDKLIILIGNNYRSRKVFEFLVIANIYWGTLMTGLLPVAPDTFISKILRKIGLLYNWSELRHFILNKYYRNNSNIAEPRFVIVGGGLAAQKAYSIYPSAELIKAHSLDYDHYLDFRDNPDRINTNISSKNLAVFLDEFGPYHPDFSHMGIKPYMDADNYFPEINRFFSYLEDRFGLEVVIAAHPRSNYHLNGKNPFGGRNCYFGQTVKLVEASQLVLTHESTAKSFAVLFNKPMLFISSQSYVRRFRVNIDAAAKVFDKTPVKISDEDLILDSKVFKINPLLYEGYISRYIKEKGTPEKFLWQIFLEYLSKK